MDRGWRVTLYQVVFNVLKPQVIIVYTQTLTLVLALDKNKNFKWF